MKFHKLKIFNFRSVSEKGIEINFGGGSNLLAVIGFNSAGKTNILNALGIVLGCYPWSRFQPSESDYHRMDTDKSIVIELWLREPLIDRDVYQKEFEIWGFRYKCDRVSRGSRKRMFRTENYCLDKDGKTLIKPTRMYRKPKADEDLDNTPLPLQTTDYAWKLGEAFYLNPSDVDSFFDKTTGWSPLGRLFDIYRDDFPAEHNKVKTPDGEIPVEKAFEMEAEKLTDILRTKKLIEIEELLSKKVSNLVSKNSGLDVTLAIPSAKDLFSQVVELFVTEHETKLHVPAYKVGAGYRALLRLAVLETLLEISDKGRLAIILAEEPEVYLHTHLERYFRRVLVDLAKKGHQIIYTTHSEDMIDLNKPQEISRLSKNTSAETVVHQVSINSRFNIEKFKTKIQGKGNEELFFCRHAILLEGQDDKIVVSTILSLLGVNSDLLSIGVFDCGSISQISDYIRMCHELGIDFFVIHDKDDETKSAIKNRNDAITGTVAATTPQLPSLFLLSPDLEGVLKTTKQGDNWKNLLNLIDGKSISVLRTSFPELFVPVDAFIKSRGIQI